MAVFQWGEINGYGKALKAVVGKRHIRCPSFAADRYRAGKLAGAAARRRPTVGFLIGTRHLLMDVHAWLAMLFLVAIAIHLMLHGSYIKAILNRSGLLKK